MKIKTLSSVAAVAAVALSFSTGLSRAADTSPLTPEYAARKENFRKQKEQQITHDMRKAAAEALKTERLKVYQARQAVKHAKPEKLDHNDK